MHQWLGWKRVLYFLVALVSFSVFSQDGLLNESESALSLEFVSSEACVDYHQVETKAWQVPISVNAFPIKLRM